ncbi:hypothetical protein BKI52_34590 [marine bacterium AO1-C]|nr:hypothetical protein BKI52_34590 [marine bacterium AO1-C]
MYQKICVIIGLLLGWFAAKGQATDSSLAHYRLPPLVLLTEAALDNAPRVKYQQAIIRRNNANIKARKKRWADKIFMDAGYSYTNNFSVMNVDASTGGFESVSLKNGDSYRFGVTFRLSLFDLIGLKHVKQGAVFEKQAAEHQLKDIEKHIRWTVTELYKNLQLAQSLLKIKSDKMQTLSLQRQMAEKEFMQGQIKIAELSRLTELTSNARQDFEKGKIEFEKAYLKLEQYVGKSLTSF